LEILRLCRNRAYHKVNSKRRQHLPASLSSFLFKEWQSMNPVTKMDARQLMAVYKKNFELAERERKRGRKRKSNNSIAKGNSRTDTAASSANGSKAGSEDEDDDAEEDNEAAVSLDNHSDKHWTMDMLHRLTECGEAVSMIVKESKNDDEMASEEKLLMQEWNNIYPNSTLTGSNLSERLSSFQASTPPSKKRKTDEEAESPDQIAMADEDEIQSSEPVTNGAVEEDIPDEISDEFAPDATASETASVTTLRARGSRRSKEDSRPISPAPVLAAASSAAASSVTVTRWACPNHWVHMFSDPDKEIECIWTKRMIAMREAVQNEFPESDLTLFKKPKGK
jgi:hypothetical protein